MIALAGAPGSPVDGGRSVDGVHGSAVVLGRAKTARHRMGVAVCTTWLAAGATIGFGGGFFDLAAVDQCCSGDVGRLRLALGYLAFAMMVWGVQT